MKLLARSSLLGSMYLSCIVGAYAQSGPPPHAPNFCTPELCLEVAPFPQPEHRRYLKPSFFTEEIDGERKIVVRFQSLGDIIVSKAVAGLGAKDSAFIKLPCDGVKGACYQVYLSTRDVGATTAKADLECQIKAIWAMSPEYRPTDNRQMSQPYIAFVLTKREGTSCVASGK